MNSKKIDNRCLTPEQKRRRDELIDIGLSGHEIGKLCGVKGQTIYYYIEVRRKKGVHKLARERRKHRLRQFRANNQAALEQALSNVAGAIGTVAISGLQDDEKEVYQNAEKYKAVTRKYADRGYCFMTLFDLFKRVDSAERNGENPSLEELGRNLEGGGNTKIALWSSAVGSILRRVGKRSFHRIKGRKTIPPEKKEIIDRGLYYTEMSCPDIAHFVEVPDYVVLRRHKKGFCIMGMRLRVCKFIADFGKGKKPTYRLASQIYKAQDQDLGFSREELIDLLDTSERVFDYVVEHRAGIERDIIRDLRIMYPNRKAERPYLD